MNRQQCVVHVVALVVIGVCLLAVPALAVDSPTLVSHVPGGRTAVAALGDYAYIGSSQFFVADVSNPSAPRLIGEEPALVEPHAVAVSGTHAYVLGSRYPYGNLLRVIDIGEPTAPVEVGFLSTAGSAEDVAVVGGYAYVANAIGWSGIQVIDVSTPSAPTEVSRVGLAEGGWGIAVSAGYAYVVGGSAGLCVIDVTEPSAPVVVGCGGAIVSDVAVSGSYLYVLGDGLRVIDVSTPSAPVEVGFVDIPDSPNAVAVSDGYAYVAGHWGNPGEGGGRLWVVDVSDPAAPVEVGHVDTRHMYEDDVAVSGGHAYVANSRCGGIRVIDVSDPSAPAVVWFLDTPDEQFVAAAGGYAYLAGSTYAGTTVNVFDMRPPTAPLEVGYGDVRSIDTTCQGVLAAAVSGGYVYLTCQFVFNEYLFVVDVSDPFAPAVVGTLGGYGGDVAASGSHAYVSGWYDGWVYRSGLQVIDVSTPSAPVEVGSIERPGVTAVVVSGRYAYLSWSDGLDRGGLWVIDVNIPSAPVEVGSLEKLGPSNGVAVSGGHAYVVAGSGGLRVIDVSTPSDPVEVGLVATPDHAYRGVAVSGDYAYVNDFNDAVYISGLRVIDASMPSAPVVVGFVSFPSPIMDITVSDGSVFVTTAYAGWYVFREWWLLFDDGFESGDTSAWSEAVP